MKERYHPSGGRWSLALATALTTGLLWGCNNTVVCGEGTRLGPDGLSCISDVDQLACPPGQIFDAETGECADFVQGDGCDAVTCDEVPADWQQSVATLRKVTLLNGGCTCVPETCRPGYNYQAGNCLQDVQVACQPGYRQEGNACIPEEDVSCYDVPASPLCVPTLCDEQPTAADGTDLRASGGCVEAPAPQAESCVSNCHNGIENPHPWFSGPELTCTGCHGGTPNATQREQAHVPIPQAWQTGSPQWGRPNLQYYWNYVTLFGPGDNVPEQQFLEWLRFRNPGDLRIADQSCGKNSGCHQDRVENTKRSVMATEVGLTGIALQRNAVPRAIIRGEGGIYKWDATEGMTLGQPELQALSYNANYTGSVQKLTKFTTRDRENFGAYEQIDILRELYNKQCGDCHLGSAGNNNRYADFRSSGCSSCHMAYALDGRSRSSDQMINKNEPTYPAAYAQIANFNVNDLQNVNGAWLGPERAHPNRHRLTRQISSQRCGSCHIGSNRTTLQFMGVQVDPNRSAAEAINNGTLVLGQTVRYSTLNEDPNLNPFSRYQGQTYDQLLEYVDYDNNGVNDISMDIHRSAGLECMDCHTGAEMHNEVKFVKVKSVTDWEDPNQVADMSGALWSHQDQATEVECVHCHGNLEYRAMPYTVDNRNPIKNFIACRELGESIYYDDDDDPATPEVSYDPPECANLGRGRYMKSKFTGNWHYIPQIVDTVLNAGNGVGGGATWPDNRGGDPIYTLSASMFHGRVDQDPNNGVGPCVNGNPAQCYKDQANNQFPITPGFSHLGDAATSPVDQGSGGLECYACHATWSNNCFGCHLTLADTNGNQLLYDYNRVTGELTLGQVAEADFSYISPQDTQFGVNSEGKIAQHIPETKQAVRHLDRNNVFYFPNRVATQNNTTFNAYRHASGYGLKQYNTELLGLPPDADGPYYEQFAQMDNNPGQGFNQMMPHSVQRADPMMNCQACHLDANNANADLVLARYGANANGFANVSAYLNVFNNIAITRNNSAQAFIPNQAAGFRFDADIDPDGFVTNMQSDWVVDVNDGFPYSYNNHPFKQGTFGLNFDPTYVRAYPRMANVAGPLPQALLYKLTQEIIVQPTNILFKPAR